MRIGFDIGGTFTDLVLDDGSRCWIHKVMTTPARPAAGALEGLEHLIGMAGASWGQVDEVVHGTTLITNAVIEGTGVRTGLITTLGFRDVLAFGRQQRYDAYDLRLPFPVPLVPRRWRREVKERVTASGEVMCRVDPEEARRVAGELAAEGVQSIAVCFLHSYRAPSNEKVATAAIREAFPELHVVASFEVAPVIREYERTVTTAACAFAQPIATGYLRELEGGLRAAGFAGRLLLMQSSGGSAAAARVAQVPIRLLESGPAGGVRAAAWIGRERGDRFLLSFDMGGTTAKACLVEASQLPLLSELEIARVDRFKSGSGLPMHTSSVDLIEIGAGGGSIATTDALGLLRVGPESASADPGPACYGLGGTEPTVTDANLVLGYLGERSLLGGRMRLHKRAAERALSRLGTRLGLGLTETAWGIHRLVNENMAAAARVHVIGRGHDPRRQVMIAFGGAGPAHCAAVGRLLGLRQIVVPVGAGANSAIGFLVAPTAHDSAVSLPGVLDQLNWEEIAGLYERMEAEAAEILRDAGVRDEEVRYVRSADMRLLGQVHEIRVPVASIGPELVEAFATAYRSRFSMLPAGIPVQVLTWRLEGLGPEGKLSSTQWSTATGGGPALKGRRPAYFPQHGYLDCPVYDRHQLRAGARISGPAVLEENEATTVLWPQDSVKVEASGHLVINLGESR